MTFDTPLIDSLPPPDAIRDRLGDVLREAAHLRRLLRVATTAEQYRDADRARRQREEAPPCRA
jgi:hypothetical protein